MEKYFKFEPVATLAALQLLGAAVLALLALTLAWSPVVVVAVGSVIEAVWAVAATFVRGAVIPTAALDELRKLSPAELASLTPGE